MKPNDSSSPNKQRSTLPVCRFHRRYQQEQHYNEHHTNPDMDIPSPLVVQEEAQRSTTPSEILLPAETQTSPLPEEEAEPPVILAEEWVAVQEDEASAAAGEASSSSSRDDDELVEAVLVGATTNDDNSHHDNISCNNVQQRQETTVPPVRGGKEKPLQLLQQCIPEYSRRGKMIWAFLAITIVGIITTLIVIVVPSDDDESSSQQQQTTLVQLGHNIDIMIPSYSLPAALNDPTSPQYKALYWLKNSSQSDLLSMEEWRKQQRYALACIYYSLSLEEGLLWHQDNDNVQQHWLDTTDECKEWTPQPVSYSAFRSWHPGFNWFWEDKKEILYQINCTATTPGQVNGLILFNIWKDRLPLKGRIPLEVQLLTSLDVLAIDWFTNDRSWTDVLPFEALTSLSKQMLPPFLQTYHRKLDCLPTLNIFA